MTDKNWCHPIFRQSRLSDLPIEHCWLCGKQVVGPVTIAFTGDETENVILYLSEKSWFHHEYYICRDCCPADADPQIIWTTYIVADELERS